jgi:methyl-accepting chemotaxis protein
MINSEINETENLISSQSFETEAHLQPVLQALKAAKNGDFTVRLPIENNGLGEIAEVFNDFMSSNQKFATEVTRMAREVGTEGKLGSQANIEGTAGTWKELIENVNGISAILGGQIRNITGVAHAIAEGDLTQKITVETQGELEVFKNTVNNMVERLNSSGNPQVTAPRRTMLKYQSLGAISSASLLTTTYVRTSLYTFP